MSQILVRASRSRIRRALIVKKYVSIADSLSSFLKNARAVSTKKQESRGLLYVKTSRTFGALTKLRMIWATFFSSSARVVAQPSNSPCGSYHVQPLRERTRNRRLTMQRRTQPWETKTRPLRLGREPH